MSKQGKHGNKGKKHTKPQHIAFKGEIIRVNRTHGFAKDTATGKEYFLTGRDLCGGIPGDTALFRIKDAERANGVLPDGKQALASAKVVRIIKENEAPLTGRVARLSESESSGRLFLEPDSFSTSEPLIIADYGGNKPMDGDKVSFTVSERGLRHSAHTVTLVTVYGSAQSARNCANAYLDEKNFRVEFPADVAGEAETACGNGIDASEIARRLDLRALPIFTIDGADTKDIDDAISIEKISGGYKLGVHIADVSHYVTRDSALDNEAFARGTSVYIADLVIPMLPKALSNGICSLNPNEDRLAFSCLMEVADSGELKSFEFQKSVICSRVQGVYGEINEILAGGELAEKYREVSAQFPLMEKLAATLRLNRDNRGAPALETAESKIVCDEDGACVDIKRRVAGASEGIIEEFMLLANNAAAKLAMEQSLPFVYRVHEPPAAEKLAQLSETLAQLGITAPPMLVTSPAGALAEIIKSAKGTEKYEIVTNAVLRAMMKAQYSNRPLGHFGLVMKEYAHFTSPIRRYPDLSIHRILSDYINGAAKDKLRKAYDKFAFESSLKSSQRELAAVSAERDCNNFYAAEYMMKHIGEAFDGIISGVAESGFFVRLPSTVEGRVSVVSLESGNGADSGAYEVKSNAALVNALTGVRFTLGDKVRVKCVGANVPARRVDFELADN